MGGHSCRQKQYALDLASNVEEQATTTYPQCMYYWPYRQRLEVQESIKVSAHNFLPGTYVQPDQQAAGAAGDISSGVMGARLLKSSRTP
jgi:hypothetical protein